MWKNNSSPWFKTATFKVVLARQLLKLLYLNEELSVPGYYSIFCCFGQNIQKIDKFWHAVILFLYPKYLDASGHLSRLPKLDSQSVGFKKRAIFFLFLLREKGQIFSFFFSLSLPKSSSPTSGWTQLSDKPSIGAARAPCNSPSEEDVLEPHLL